MIIDFSAPEFTATSNQAARKEHVEAEVWLILGRYQYDIKKLVINVHTGVSAAQRYKQYECALQATLFSGQTIEVRETAAELDFVLSIAMHRMKRYISRTIYLIQTLKQTKG
ncbi:hypothetical protein EAG18_13450 [Pseudoalteromonas sp. J010]|uniref:hypothetical protein n=1 Tax=Pseudoalteromonas sp. J010 TaxID=998465 RepID=UPI000F653652|nr:hypothetical protein [Pseudoalteromonas sp. J010]RRS08178.1 hypothetical protein EAG18_13450 [Pseudoalteromonas sp. J010]